MKTKKLREISIKREVKTLFYLLIKVIKSIIKCSIIVSNNIKNYKKRKKNYRMNAQNRLLR